MKLTAGMSIHLFLRYIEDKNYSKDTQNAYTSHIEFFFNWLAEYQHKNDAREVTKNDLFRYQVFLSAYQSFKTKKVLSSLTQRTMVVPVKSLFKFLSRNDYILVNPFDSVDGFLPLYDTIRNSVTEGFMAEVLDSIELDTKIGIRDRAILELMYGTGLRVSEVAQLLLTDIDLHTGRLYVRDGKGKKDRIVPLGSTVIQSLKLYLKSSRSNFVKTGIPDERKQLFLSLRGKGLSASRMKKIVKKRGEHIDSIEKEHFSPHVIRHSFATHMLEHGAGVKHVKDILGHSSMETTVRYTHFSVESLKRILRMYHPRENQLYKELTEQEKKNIQRILES